MSEQEQNDMIVGLLRERKKLIGDAALLEEKLRRYSASAKALEDCIVGVTADEFVIQRGGVKRTSIESLNKAAEMADASWVPGAASDLYAIRERLKAIATTIEKSGLD
jgi:hypothetical protein